MGRMTYAVYGCDGAAAALHIIRHPMVVQRLLTHSIKLVLNLPTPKGWKDESSSRVPRPGVEPRPLASEASVLPFDHLLSLTILTQWCTVFISQI